MTAVLSNDRTEFNADFINQPVVVIQHVIGQDLNFFGVVEAQACCEGIGLPLFDGVRNVGCFLLRATHCGHFSAVDDGVAAMSRHFFKNDNFRSRLCGFVGCG